MDKNILYTLAQQSDQLPKAERRLAGYIQNHASEIVAMNVTVLSKAAKVSPATIIRLCHSLGLKGFTDLKLSISAVSSQLKQDSYSEIIANEPIEQIQIKLKQNIFDGIEVTNKELKTEAILKAVTWIQSAEMVYTTGIGASYLVAQDIEQKLNRVGKGTIATLDFHFLTTAMVTQSKPSVLILISNSGDKKELAILADVARQQAIPILLISHAEQSLLAQKSDLLLKTAKAREAAIRSAATSSLMLQLFVVDILYTALVSKNSDQMIAYIESSRAVIDENFS